MDVGCPLGLTLTAQKTKAHPFWPVVTRQLWDFPWKQHFRDTAGRHVPQASAQLSWTWRYEMLTGAPHGTQKAKVVTGHGAMTQNGNLKKKKVYSLKFSIIKPDLCLSLKL